MSLSSFEEERVLPLLLEDCSLRTVSRLTGVHRTTIMNLRAAVALYVAWYDFCRIRGSPRVTPVMAAGITQTA